MRSSVGHRVLTAASALALSAGIIAVGSPASAAASGCTVWRYTTPPSTTYNTGSARCATLTNGSKVRVVVWCKNEIFPPFYGPWVTKANKDSVYNCGGEVAAAVDYQTA